MRAPCCVTRDSDVCICHVSDTSERRTTSVTPAQHAITAPSSAEGRNSAVPQFSEQLRRTRPNPHCVVKLLISADAIHDTDTLAIEPLRKDPPNPAKSTISATKIQYNVVITYGAPILVVRAEGKGFCSQADGRKKKAIKTPTSTHSLVFLPNPPPLRVHGVSSKKTTQCATRSSLRAILALCSLLKSARTWA